jgi:hypothetical protein
VSASETIAIVTSVLALVALAVLLVVLGSALQTLRVARRMVSDFEAQAFPLLDELRVAVERASDEVARVDAALGSVTAVSRTLEEASQVASSAVTAPVVKVLALSAGTRSAYQRFRGRRS